MQKQPIAPAHHSDAVGNKTTCLVLARISLEIFLVTTEAEQDFGNGAIAFAM